MLNERSGAAIIHASQPEVHPLQEYTLPFQDDHPVGVILDRWHIGQWVYPQLYPEGRTPLAREEWLWIELFLMSRGAVLTYVDDHDIDGLRRRIEKDKDSYLKVDDVEKCVRLFYAATRMSILPTYPVRWGNSDDVNRLATKAWAAWSTTGLNSLRFPHAIGNLTNARIMLVGDQVGNVKPEGATHTVPFAPYPHAAGRYLMRALLEWDHQDQTELVIVNARRPDGSPEELWSLWARVGRPRVVALGKRAHERLLEESVPHGSVPHPQFVRRFHHDKVSEYSKAIRSVSESGLQVFGEEFDAVSHR